MKNIGNILIISLFFHYHTYYAMRHENNANPTNLARYNPPPGVSLPYTGDTSITITLDPERARIWNMQQCLRPCCICMLFCVVAGIGTVAGLHYTRQRI